jgi:uncharacterized protein (DUF488 family)
MNAPKNDPVRHAKPVIYTIGHSTRPREEFLAILKAYGIELVVDVRSIPKSRHNPQFNSEAMEISFPENGIAYEQMRKLGGLRHPKRNSRNRGWDNASFRGFADYMQTSDFERGWKILLLLHREKRRRSCAPKLSPGGVIGR